MAWWPEFGGRRGQPAALRSAQVPARPASTAAKHRNLVAQNDQLSLETNRLAAMQQQSKGGVERQSMNRTKHPGPPRTIPEARRSGNPSIAILSLSEAHRR
jgi:hypothetical protein